MSGIMRGDQHRLDLTVGDQLMRITGDARADRLRDTRRPIMIKISEHADPCPRDVPVQNRCVIRTHHAGPDDADLHDCPRSQRLSQR